MMTSEDKRKLDDLMRSYKWECMDYYAEGNGDAPPPPYRVYEFVESLMDKASDAGFEYGLQVASMPQATPGQEGK